MIAVYLIKLDEEKIPLNDVWIYNIHNRVWAEIKVSNPDLFDGRLCHSSCVFGDKVYVYGGRLL